MRLTASHFGEICKVHQQHPEIYPFSHITLSHWLVATRLVGSFAVRKITDFYFCSPKHPEPGTVCSSYSSYRGSCIQNFKASLFARGKRPSKGSGVGYGRSSKRFPIYTNLIRANRSPSYWMGRLGIGAATLSACPLLNSPPAGGEHPATQPHRKRGRSPNPRQTLGCTIRVSFV